MTDSKRPGLLTMMGSLLRARFEERLLREEVARNERLQIEVSSRMFEEVVRRVEPEDDGFLPIDGGGRELDGTTAQSLREQALRASIKSPHCRGFLGSLNRFVMGKGPTFTPDVEDDQLKGRINEWWKQFKRVNDWDKLEDEIPERTWRDGETFVRRFVKTGGEEIVVSDQVKALISKHGGDLNELTEDVDIPEGMVQLRLISPEQIDDPTGLVSNGIITDQKDVQTVLGYVWAVDGKIKEIIKASNILHTKIGVDSDIKRGRSLLEAILKNDARFDTWLDYRITLNYVRTAAALFKKVNGTPTQVQQVRDAQAKQQDTTLNGRRLQMLKPGSTITHNAGVEYEFKSPNINATDAKEDGRSLLLTMAAATGLPEYMFTGDASNANFASTMVSESPAVREFESWQDFFTPVFSHIWHWVIEAGADHGGIDGLTLEAAKKLSVAIEWPPMMSRDELEHTQANKLRNEGGILSREGWAVDDGIPWDVEQERLAAELKGVQFAPALEMLSKIERLVATGALTPDPELERWIRTLLGAPIKIGEEPAA